MQACKLIRAPRSCSSVHAHAQRSDAGAFSLLASPARRDSRPHAPQSASTTCRTHHITSDRRASRRRPPARRSTPSSPVRTRSYSTVKSSSASPAASSPAPSSTLRRALGRACQAASPSLAYKSTRSVVEAWNVTSLTRLQNIFYHSVQALVPKRSRAQCRNKKRNSAQQPLQPLLKLANVVLFY